MLSSTLAVGPTKLALLAMLSVPNGSSDDGGADLLPGAGYPDTPAIFTRSAGLLAGLQPSIPGDFPVTRPVCLQLVELPNPGHLLKITQVQGSAKLPGCQTGGEIQSGAHSCMRPIPGALSWRG